MQSQHMQHYNLPFVLVAYVITQVPFHAEHII